MKEWLVIQQIKPLHNNGLLTIVKDVVAARCDSFINADLIAAGLR